MSLRACSLEAYDRRSMLREAVSPTSMAHVERNVEILLRLAHKPRRLDVSVVEKSHLVELIQVTSLPRDVGGREVQASVKIARVAGIDELGDDLAVEGRVKLVDHDTMKARQLLDDADKDFEERVQRGRRRKLFLHLRHDVEYLHGAGLAPLPPRRSQDPQRFAEYFGAAGKLLHGGVGSEGVFRRVGNDLVRRA
ncbi:hypothetical protein HYQ46_001577 [Verticillium longisporum]|nr:hypothetical protein HYQ46_001577 [Verticillium longisporum]